MDYYGSYFEQPNFTSMYSDYSWNFTNTFSELEYEDRTDVMTKSSARLAFICVASLVLVLGFIENTLVIFVTVGNKTLKRQTKIFIIVLAGSSVLMCAFHWPLILHYSVTGYNWSFGEALCKLAAPTLYVPVYVISLTICFIAIDRYCLIIHPIHRQTSPLLVITVESTIIVATVLLSLPAILNMKYVIIDWTDQGACVINWKNLEHKQVYSTVTTLVQFFGPLFVASFLHFLNMQSNLTRALLVTHSSNLVDKKVDIILLILTLVFALSWSPHIGYWLVVDFRPNLLLSPRYTNLTIYVLNIVAMSHAMINPCFYALLIRRTVQNPPEVRRENTSLAVAEDT